MQLNSPYLIVLYNHCWQVVEISSKF